MSSRCANCGGTLEYDISLAKLKCIHCDSVFEPDDFAADSSAEESVEADEKEGVRYETTVFSCPSCGAQISSTELTAMDYCVYCGSVVTLESQMARVERPKFIVPFSKTSAECKEIYRKMLRNKIYAPKEFKNDEFLEGFKGIYIPYRQYEFSYGPNIRFDGELQSREGDYLITQEYNIKCIEEGTVRGISYDGSSTFDDELSNKVTYIDSKKEKPFNPSYMFGFFADTSDVEAKVYNRLAADAAEDVLWSHFHDNPDFAKGHPSSVTPSEMKDDFNIRRSSHLTMFPIWFLTWRKNDRVAYSIVNGDTGKSYAEVPISIMKYLLFSLITAVPIFLLLNCVATFNVSRMLKISMVMALAMMMFYSFQLDKIVSRLTHKDDLGYLSKHKDAKKNAENVKDNLLKVVLDVIISLFKGMGLWSIVILGVLIFTFSMAFVIGLYVLAVAIPIYVIYRIIKDAKQLRDKTVWRDVAGAVVALVLGLVILVADPAPDMFYYFAAIVCMVGDALSAVSIMSRYNELITRPVPHFFEREKGGTV